MQLLYYFPGPRDLGTGKWGLISELEKRQPGELFHARWITLAARIIRVYFSLEPNDPNFGALKIIALLK